MRCSDLQLEALGEKGTMQIKWSTLWGQLSHRQCLVSPAHAGRKGNPKDTKARSKLNIETYGRENANHATSNVGANPAPG